MPSNPALGQSASSELLSTTLNIPLGSFCGGPSERVRGASYGMGESLAAEEGDTHHNARKRLARLKSRDIVTREKIRERGSTNAGWPTGPLLRERGGERPHCRTTRLTAAVRVAVKFRRPQKDPTAKINAPRRRGSRSVAVFTCSVHFISYRGEGGHRPAAWSQLRS